ncbi:MAG TPA: ribosome-associated translation inhibitor RaiA [Chloroflexi bacterium]|nr:ribosome-associated translation inhibitor RaiA [Chloroflexota bacterium]
MNIIITGKNMEIGDVLRNYVEKKVTKLNRYLPTASEARVELAVEGTKDAEHSQVAQITLRSNGTILRSEERSSDIFASVDAALDKIHRQIIRYKEKRYRRGRGPEKESPLLEEEETPHIVRTKRFPVRPMDEEEAIEQMELLGHDFFVFFNASTGQVNVLYRRQDGNYGLIEPEPT